MTQYKCKVRHSQGLTSCQEANGHRPPLQWAWPTVLSCGSHSAQARIPVCSEGSPGDFYPPGFQAGTTTLGLQDAEE